MKTRKTGGGRPPKFLEPRHPVTMTLPERVLSQLSRIDPDRARAVVKAADALAGTAAARFRPVETVKMAPGKSLIVVGPNQSLRSIPWLSLIEIAPARYLLTVPSGTPIEALEVALRDLLRQPEARKDERENAVLNDLLELIGDKRRTRHLSKAEILVIDSDRE